MNSLDSEKAFVNFHRSPFENLVPLAFGALEEGGVDRVIKIANSILNETESSLALAHISYRFFKFGHVEGALAIAKRIPIEHIKYPFLLSILQRSLDEGNVEKAPAIANTLPEETRKSLESTSFRQLKNEVDLQIECANKKSNPIDQSLALRMISKRLLKKGFIGWAIKVANTIPNEEIKCVILKDISNHLGKVGYIDWAIEIANTLSDEKEKSRTFCKICDQLAKKDYIDWAIEIANTLSGESKSEALRSISLQCLEDGRRVGRAIEIADSIPDEKEKAMAFEHISIRLVKEGYIDFGIGIANTISEERKSWALKDISIFLVGEGFIDFGKKIADTIPLKVIKSRAFRDIHCSEKFFVLKRSFEEGNVEKAKEIANTIPDLYEKYFALDWIATRLEEGKILHHQD